MASATTELRNGFKTGQTQSSLGEGQLSTATNEMSTVSQRPDHDLTDLYSISDEQDWLLANVKGGM